MMKFKHYLRLALCTALGFIAAGFLFFPWNAIGDYLMARGLTAAAKNGIYAAVAANSAQGVIDKEFVYQKVTADFPVFRFSASQMIVNPGMIRTIATAKPSCKIQLGRGEIIPVTRQKLEWVSGAADISVSGGIIYVSNIDFKGKFSANGFLEISAETGKMSRANMTLRVPQEMDRAFEMLGSSGMVPITKVKAGEWKVER